MSKNLTTPILLKRQNKNYKLLYITFSSDGSIYINYPRKKGYEIISKTDITQSIKKQTKIKLKRKNTGVISPKISFHPGNMSIHVSGKDEKIFQTDSKILNFGKELKCFPLCQIIFPPAVSYLDKYNKKKYFKPLEINVNNPEASLSLNFWIHPPKGHLDLNDLPHLRQLKKVSTIITSRKFSHTNLKDYTITVFIHDLGIRKKQKNKSKNIITIVFNDNCPYVFEIAPKTI
jgi:hypothetical protein